MKVFHLISGGDSGGAKTHLFSLLDKLKLLADVRVGCLMDGVFYTELKQRDVDNVLFKQKNRADLSVVSKIADMINKEGFDVFHVHGARACFIASFVMKKINIPTVVTMHSDYLLDFDQFIKKLIFTNLNKRALKKIPYFIAVSDSFKDMLISRNFKPNSIYTVYNGMDFSSVPDKTLSKQEYAEKCGFTYDENEIYIGIAARFDIVKGVDIFIKAAEQVLKTNKNVTFLIAGEGDEKDKLISLAEKSGFKEKIKFIGFEKNIYDFLNIIDINCLTSLSESFPYSMLEGAAMGKPMVASKVGGIPSLVIEGETGLLFESGNYMEMAEKLTELISNPSEIKRMGDNIKKRATTLFTNDNFAKTHMDIYEQIIADFNDKKTYDFAVSGYYGFHNNGDDALLLALIEDIKKKKPDARILVLSHKPKETKMVYKVDIISRINILKLISALKKTKVLLSGGGSLLQDESSSKSLWYYLFIIKLAKRCGAEVMQFANGFGPVSKPFNQKFTANVINNCVDLITLRDEESEKAMREIGIKKDILVTADPAMLLEGISEKERNKLFTKEQIPSDKYISVSVRDWKKNVKGFETEVGKALKSFAVENNLNVVFVPMQYPNDVNISKKVASIIGDKAFVVKNPLEIKEAIGIIAGAEINVTMRLHAMIYSVSNGIRTVALKYDPKIDGFMDYVGLDGIVNVETLDKDTLYAKLCKAYQNLPNADFESLKEKAKINTKKALELL